MTAQPLAPTLPLVLARQPVLATSEEARGYELVFGPQGASIAGADPERAAAVVIAGALTDPLIRELAPSLPLYVEHSAAMLQAEVPLALPPERLVVEVSPHVARQEGVDAFLRRLRRLGYGVLLDMPVIDRTMRPDLGLADRIRIPVPGSAKAGPILRAWKEAGVELIARGLETREQFELCKTLGFDLYQGFFFRCPQLVTGEGIPAHKAVLGRIMARLGDPQLDTEELDAMVRQDPGLTYRLLVIANSALYAPPAVVSSLRQAMVMLGFERVRRILGVVAVAGVIDEPREVAFGAVQRGRMCEVLGGATRVPPASLFMVGLLSVMDALLGRPMREVVGAIAVASDLASALLGRSGEAGRVLAAIDAHERAEWSAIEQLGFDPADVTCAWLEGTAWAQDLWRNLDGGGESA